MNQVRNKRTIAALTLSAALVCGVLVACGVKKPSKDAENQSSSPPAERTGVTLRFFQPKPDQAALWQTLAVDYQNLTGVEIVVESSTADKPLGDLKERLAGDTNAPNLFFFTNHRESKAWGENVADLGASTHFGRLTEPRFAYEAEGKKLGLPLGVEPFGIIVNKKILEQYFSLENKATDFEELLDIQSHAELKALVEDLQKNKEALGIDGVFAAPSFKDGENTTWTTRLLSVPHGHEIAGGGLDLSGKDVNELGLKHEKGYQGFLDLHHANRTGTGSANTKLEERTMQEAVQEFATGKAAMILGGTEFWGQLTTSNSAATEATIQGEDCAFLPIFLEVENASQPQGLAFEVTEYVAVNQKQSPEQRQATEDFLDWLVSSDRGLRFLSQELMLLAPYRTVTEEHLPQNPLSASAYQWLNDDTVKSTVLYGNLMPGEEFRDKVVGKHLLSYHKGETKWEEFTKKIKEGWKEYRGKLDESF